MRIISESGIKNGSKFLVFMSDEGDQMDADLICVTFDFTGKALVHRKIQGFFKFCKTCVSRDLQDFLPEMDEANKNRLQDIKEDYRKKNPLGYRITSYERYLLDAQNYIEELLDIENNDLRKTQFEHSL